MGLIFKKAHIELVLKGVKTQTRRRHRNVLKAGRVYSVKTNYFTTTGHRVRITRVRRERLGDISEEDAYAEGGYTVEEYMDVWRRINGSWDPDEEVVVYEFEVIDEPELSSIADLGCARVYFFGKYQILIYI